MLHIWAIYLKIWDKIEGYKNLKDKFSRLFVH